MVVLSSPVQIKNGINFRDLGGIRTQDGRTIRSGRLYRAGAFTELTVPERDYLSQTLQIGHVLDYRDVDEIKNYPYALWQGAHYYNVPANPLTDEVSANLDHEFEKKHVPNDFMLRLYRLLPFNNRAYKQLVHLLSADDSQPLVQHCAVGKDRTGVGVALTLFALGVEEETVMADYLLTETLLADFREKILHRFSEQMDATQLAGFRQLFAAKEEYLATALACIKQKYTSIDNWLASEYGLTTEHKQVLQNKYLA